MIPFTVRKLCKDEIKNDLSVRHKIKVIETRVKAFPDIQKCYERFNQIELPTTIIQFVLQHFTAITNCTVLLKIYYLFDEIIRYY